MELIAGKSFTNQTINLDGKHFIGCEFIKCRLIYSGGEFGGLERCRVGAGSGVMFAGAASRTLEVAKKLGFVEVKKDIMILDSGNSKQSN